MYPFYYIDYALAQLGAFEFYVRMLQDREAAWADYKTLCRAGGSRSYRELLQLAGLSDPFAKGSVERIIAPLRRMLIDEDRESPPCNRP